MATRNSIDNEYSNNADGGHFKGGIVSRMLKWLGADITITGSGTSIYTFPAATDTLVGRASTDTLTNKTLTSPVVNTPTGIVKGDVGLGNVDNTSNVTERAATATLTNKTILPSVNNVAGGIYSLTTNQAATAATTVLVGATWTLPGNLATAGMVIKVKVFYRFVKTTSPPTLTCNLNVAGSSVAQIIITNVSSAITSGGMLEGSVTILTTGAGGTLMSSMVGQNDHGITNATNWNPQIVNIATSSINTTTTNVISIDMKMTTGVASNTLTISQGYVEIVKP